MLRGRAGGGNQVAAPVAGATVPIAVGLSGSGTRAPTTAKFCTRIRKITAQPALAATTRLKTTSQQLDLEIGQVSGITPARVNDDPSLVEPSAVSALTGTDVTTASGNISVYTRQRYGVTPPTTLAP